MMRALKEKRSKLDNKTQSNSAWLNSAWGGIDWCPRDVQEDLAQAGKTDLAYNVVRVMRHIIPVRISRNIQLQALWDNNGLSKRAANRAVVSKTEKLELGCPLPPPLLTSKIAKEVLEQIEAEQPEPFSVPPDHFARSLSSHESLEPDNPPPDLKRRLDTNLPKITIDELCQAGGHLASGVDAANIAKTKATEAVTKLEHQKQVVDEMITEQEADAKTPEHESTAHHFKASSRDSGIGLNNARPSMTEILDDVRREVAHYAAMGLLNAARTTRVSSILRAETARAARDLTQRKGQCCTGTRGTIGTNGWLSEQMQLKKA
ncbi:hypothetical protein ACHAO9_012623 [Fusarium lateritium]